MCESAFSGVCPLVLNFTPRPLYHGERMRCPLYSRRFSLHILFTELHQPSQH